MSFSFYHMCLLMSKDAIQQSALKKSFSMIVLDIELTGCQSKSLNIVN